MADKRISQLVERTDIANNDVVPIVASGATTTNKATISSIQEFMQENLDLGVTSVGITLGTTGTDVSVTGSPITTSGNITINLPTASATNRGLLSSADWTTFNNKQAAGNYVTLDTAQTITAQKTFTTSGSSDTMIISHGSGSGFALDVIKAGNGEAIRVQKTSGSGNAMTISGGNFEAGTIVRTGGTSSQFLKADGSVDSSTYLTTGTAASTYVPYTGATGAVNLGTHSLSANNLTANGGTNAGRLELKNADNASLIRAGYFVLSPSSSNTIIQFGFGTGASTWKNFGFSSHLIPDNTITLFSLPSGGGTLAVTTDLGAYLPLTGGTLTGALNGTSASFTSSLISNNYIGTTLGSGGIYFSGNASPDIAYIGYNYTNVNGTETVYQSTRPSWRQHFGNGSTTQWKVAYRAASAAAGAFTDYITIASTGAATFSSSVTAAGATISGTTALASTGGTSQMRIDRSGSVARIQNYDTGSAANISLAFDGGNVGIGTASPTYKLHLKSTGLNSIAFAVQRAANTNNIFYVYEDSSGNGNVTLENSGGTVGVYLNSAGSSYFNGGNVGIGTASPGTYDSAKIGTSHKFLNVQSSSSAYAVATLAGNQSSADSRIGYLTFVNDNNSSSYKYSAWLGSEVEGSTANQQGGRLIFSTSGDASSAGPIERMRISSGGNVGIAVSGNPEQLSVAATSANNVARFKVDVNGNGIVFANSSNSLVGSISINASTVSYNITSDYRLKEDLQEIEGLEKIQAIKVYNYKWKSEESRMDGVLAHELAEVLPYAVNGEKDAVDEEGNDIMQGVDYSKIVPILIKAIQEQQEQIDSLKNQIK